MRQGWIAVALAASPFLADAAGAAPTAEDLLRALGMTAGADGQVANACDERVTPAVNAIDFGGAVGTAALLVIPGGPQMATCYGDVPGDMYLMIAEGAGFRTLFHGGGYVILLPTQHRGVHDFALGGPGMSFPVYVWTGKTFAAKGKISDAKLQALGNLPTYPQ